MINLEEGATEVKRKKQVVSILVLQRPVGGVAATRKYLVQRGGFQVT